MNSISIKGKEYVTVNERVKAFRSMYSNWAINTEVIFIDANSVVIKASAFDETGRLRSTGIAQEFRDNKQSMVNSTSYVENCETSAVGRCLGLMGIGIDTSIASADEVARAIGQQEAMQPQRGENNLYSQAKQFKTADEVLKFYNEHQAEIETDAAVKAQIISLGKELRAAERKVAA